MSVGQKDPGMANWDYAHCLPYFKRMETYAAGSDEFRGGNGPFIRKGTC